MNPVDFTETRYPDRIVSEARSVKVTIPASSTILPNDCFYVAPFLGVAMEAVTTGEGETQDIALAVGPLIIATTKLTSGQTFAKGTAVYWDATTQKFTETRTDIPAGWVYKAKGSESVPVAYIFLTGPAPTPVDLTDAQLVVDGLKAADLALLAGLEEQAHIADVANVAGEDAAALVTDINKAGGIVAKINAILALLETLGLVATE